MVGSKSHICYVEGSQDPKGEIKAHAEEYIISTWTWLSALYLLFRLIYHIGTCLSLLIFLKSEVPYHCSAARSAVMKDSFLCVKKKDLLNRQNYIF